MGPLFDDLCEPVDADFAAAVGAEVEVVCGVGDTKEWSKSVGVAVTDVELEVNVEDDDVGVAAGPGPSSVTVLATTCSRG